MIDKEKIISDRIALVKALNGKRSQYRVLKEDITHLKDEIHELKIKLNILDMSLIGER